MSISRILARIDGRGYKAYKDLAGAVEAVDGVKVRVARVQGDPFAPPSVVVAEARVEPGPWTRAPVAAADYALRKAWREAQRLSIRGAGEGHSGMLRLPRPGPAMLRRSALELVKYGEEWNLIMRVWAGLPSRRRRVLAGVAEELLLDRTPRLWRAAARALSEKGVEDYVRAWVEQEYIRSRLPALGLVSFVGDGSILPRACGGCEEPLEGAVPFESPQSLRVELELPTGRTITGMGIREGLTLIAGPAFHGKTTLLEAIAAGVWNHKPRDGRELVVTRKDAVWIRSENGRSVSCVDVSPWIESLPSLRDTKCWSTLDASGATSAIASLQEAVEAGSRLILIDEDWTATNFIHRDVWIEKITGKRTLLTISDLAPALRRAGVNIVIVASGSPQILAAADTVIVMDEYKPVDATNQAKKHAKPDTQTPIKTYKPPKPRKLTKPIHLQKPKLIGTQLKTTITIDLTPVTATLQEETQLKTAVQLTYTLLDKPGEIRETATKLAKLVENGQWKKANLPETPDHTQVRPLDIIQVTNRIPNLPITNT